MRKGVFNEKKYSDINVLLLDDDLNVLDSLKNLIKRNGYQCTTTNNPDEALKIIKDAEPKIDIFITDYLMIGITGMDVIRDLRQFNRDIYVILLTGYANNMPWDYAIRNFDIDSYSEKDVSFKDLLIKIEIAIKNITKYKFFESDGLKFEEKLKYAREQKNMTQDETAEAIGVIRSTIAGYEGGTIKPSFENIRKLAKLYDVSYDFLLG
jgi:response regulator RpfG family c-di-GMP phosphodiesterase